MSETPPETIDEFDQGLEDAEDVEDGDYTGPDPEADESGDASDEDQGT